MPALDWVQWNEFAIGANHPQGRTDTINRALQELIVNSGRTTDDPNLILSWGDDKVLDVKAHFGAVGDGVTDDTAAFQACADAAKFGVMVIPPGQYNLTSNITISGFTTIRGAGLFNTRLIKAHAGTGFTINGNYINVFDVMWEGSGTAGDMTAGYAYEFAASQGYGCQFRGGGCNNIDLFLKFNGDAGHATHFTDIHIYTYTSSPGSEPDTIYIGTDTSAGFRHFTSVFMISKFVLRGALDTFIAGCGIRSIDSDSATSILTVCGTILANNNNPITLAGDNISIVGSRISGNVTLASGSNGNWANNKFTFGALTDSSGNPNNWCIVQKIDGSTLTQWMQDSLLRFAVGGILVPNSVDKPGNAAVSTVTTGTPTKHTILFNTPLTADRAVTLNTGADYKNGDSYHIIRTAAATGAFNVNVGSGPLKALAAGTWCIVTYDGSTWFLTAYGSL